MTDTTEPSARYAYRILVLTGVIYASWWLLARFADPAAYNPLDSRVAVVALCFVVAALSQAIAPIAANLPACLTGCLMVVTAHNYFLLHHNYRSTAWIASAYITVAAVCAVQTSRRTYAVYAFFVCLLTALVCLLHAELRGTFAMPGVMMIVAISYVGLHSRMRLVGELQESAHRIEDLFNSTFEGIVIHDQGRIVDINRAIEDLLGYSRTEIIGKNILDFVTPTDRKLIAMRFEGIAHERYNTFVICKDGSQLPIEATSKMYTYNGKVVRMAAVRDVSERVRADAERLLHAAAEAARLDAERASKFKSMFLGLVGHELVSPLQTILLNTTSPAWEEIALGSGFQDKLTRTTRASKRLLELIQTLLEYSRVEQGALRAHCESFDAAPMIHELVDELRGDAERKHLALVMDCEPSCDARNDVKLVRIIASNLVTNAIKYTDEGQVTVRLRHTATAIDISVEDTGRGIAPDEQSMIFQPFLQLSELRHKLTPGVGLGLSIVKELTQALGGTLQVDSALGKGSRFRVCLPNAPVQTAQS